MPSTHIFSTDRSNFCNKDPKSTARLFPTLPPLLEEVSGLSEQANSADVKSSKVSRTHIRSFSRRILLGGDGDGGDNVVGGEEASLAGTTVTVFESVTSVVLESIAEDASGDFVDASRNDGMCLEV